MSYTLDTALKTDRIHIALCTICHEVIGMLPRRNPAAGLLLPGSNVKHSQQAVGLRASISMVHTYVRKRSQFICHSTASVNLATSVQYNPRMDYFAKSLWTLTKEPFDHQVTRVESRGSNQ